MSDIELRKCNRCHKEKPPSEFANPPGTPNRPRTRCDYCRNVALRWKRKQTHDPEQHRRYVLRSRYGLTPEDFEALLAEQGGRCALCGSTNPHGRYDRFLVDHCHDTGRVRGLLCPPCNTLIGSMGDNAEGVRKVISYLEDTILPYVEGGHSLSTPGPRRVSTRLCQKVMAKTSA